MRIKNFGFLALPAVLLGMSSCLGDDDEDNDYKEWRQQNIDYILSAENSRVGGQKEYEKIIPAWDQASFTLMKWHNDRSATAGNMSPLDNSTIAVKYLLTNIEGDTIDSSYKMTAYGDSTYHCRPCEMITGFWIATTNMHVGDSVTAVIPYSSGYGVLGSGAVLPYSTLIFQIKLDSIVALETLPWRP